MTCPQRLLAIDDNTDSADLIVRIAGKCGYEARAMVDVTLLPQLIRHWMPDIITLDLCMPQDDGIAALSVLSQNSFTGSLLIISGQDDWLRQAAARLASAHGLRVAADIAKPINIQELRKALSSLSVRAAVQ
jgi:CheY-like chemotaxis protein